MLHSVGDLLRVDFYLRKNLVEVSYRTELLLRQRW